MSNGIINIYANEIHDLLPLRPWSQACIYGEPNLVLGVLSQQSSSAWRLLSQSSLAFWRVCSSLRV